MIWRLIIAFHFIRNPEPVLKKLIYARAYSMSYKKVAKSLMVN